MKNKLSDNGMSNAVSAKAILATKGKMLTTGFMDEIDMEAERAANAISRRNGMTPRKVGQAKSGFGRTAYHPNRSPVMA